MANYLVDVTDVTGDCHEDYRMPVIWEYDSSGYRLPNQLSFDMGLLTIGEQALERFHGWDYVKAVSDARKAYTTLAKAAESIGLVPPTLPSP